MSCLLRCVALLQYATVFDGFLTQREATEQYHERADNGCDLPALDHDFPHTLGTMNTPAMTRRTPIDVTLYCTKNVPKSPTV